MCTYALLVDKIRQGYNIFEHIIWTGQPNQYNTWQQKYNIIISISVRSKGHRSSIIMMYARWSGSWYFISCARLTLQRMKRNKICLMLSSIQLGNCIPGQRWYLQFVQWGMVFYRSKGELRSDARMQCGFPWTEAYLTDYESQELKEIYIDTITWPGCVHQSLHCTLQTSHTYPLTWEV